MKNRFKFIILGLLLCGLLLDLGLRSLSKNVNATKLKKEQEIEALEKFEELFISQIHEPIQDFSFIPNITHDFNADYTQRMDILTIISEEDVRIVELESIEELDVFLEKIEYCTDIEALQIVNTSIDNDRMEALILGLSDKVHFKKLSLVNCYIDVVPPSIRKLKRLKTLNIFNNPIKELPPEIGELKELEFLRVYHCTLFKKLPLEIGQLENLRYLHLEQTQLSSLPLELGQCKKLIHATVKSASLTEVPYALFKFNALKYLNLSYNQIKDLSEEIYQFNELETLIISNNRLSNLPDHFPLMKSLKYCTLSNNEFEEFPLIVFHSDRLRYLIIKGNSFSYVPFEIIGMDALRFIEVDPEQLDATDIEGINAVKSDLYISDGKKRLPDLRSGAY